VSNLADVEVIDRFFLNVWLTLRRLLAEVDRYKMREELLGELEDKKLSYLADRLRQRTTEEGETGAAHFIGTTAACERRRVNGFVGLCVAVDVPAGAGCTSCEAPIPPFRLCNWRTPVLCCGELNSLRSKQMVSWSLCCQGRVKLDRWGGGKLDQMMCRRWGLTGRVASERRPAVRFADPVRPERKTHRRER